MLVNVWTKDKFRTTEVRAGQSMNVFSEFFNIEGTNGMHQSHASTQSLGFHMQAIVINIE